jgi:hypothetical protein
MVHLGVPVGGRVRKLRAVEDPSVPIPYERTNKLGGIICNLVRRVQLRIKSAAPWNIEESFFSK